MREEKYPEGPIKRKWFRKGYEEGWLDEAEQHEERSPLEKTIEKEEQNMGRNLGRLRDLIWH